MRSDLPFGTVTFLFTDVEGSTTLLHELGADSYASALSEHRRIVRRACAAERGVEVDTQGDAFFFAFGSASGAISAAAAFTEQLASGPIQVRVGLHTGTPLVTAEGYVGDDVHLAARVAATSHGGQVVLSHATAWLMPRTCGPRSRLGWRPSTPPRPTRRRIAGRFDLLSERSASASALEAERGEIDLVDGLEGDAADPG
jgi:class 3 adenylate cyclase